MVQTDQYTDSNSNDKDSQPGNLLSFLRPKNWKINLLASKDPTWKSDKSMQKSHEIQLKAKFISRDLSWLKFDERVLDQARDTSKSLFDRLKFLAITASNLDEFLRSEWVLCTITLTLGRKERIIQAYEKCHSSKCLFHRRRNLVRKSINYLSMRYCRFFLKTDCF